MYSPLIITGLAEEDILNTATYIADVLKAPAAANNLLDEIERHEEILEHTPAIYPLVPDEYLAQGGMRFAIIKKYLLFYVINEDEKTVTVIRFLYGRRDWIHMLKTGQAVSSNADQPHRL